MGVSDKPEILHTSKLSRAEKKLKITFLSEAPNMVKEESEIRSWRDRNLKFGTNCDLEVDVLGKKTRQQ